MVSRPFRLGGWVGSSLIADRLAAPCGCDTLTESEGASDDGARMLAEMAHRQQRAWSCPAAGLDGETDDPEALASLDAIAVLTRVPRGCLTTCPNWHARSPDIVRAATYHRYVEAGCPDAIEADPPAALIRASHLVGVGYADRMRAEREEREAKRSSDDR